MSASLPTIPFIVAQDTAKGTADATFAAVPADALARNLDAACDALAGAFAGLREVGGFHLTEVSIGLEISGEGGVSFIGTAKVGAKAAVTLKFSPPPK